MVMLPYAGFTNLLNVLNLLNFLNVPNLFTPKMQHFVVISYL